MCRAQSLPGVAVDGEAVGLSLADDLTAQALAGLLVVAVRAGEVELAASALEKNLSGLEERCRWSIDAHIHEEPA